MRIHRSIAFGLVALTAAVSCRRDTESLPVATKQPSGLQPNVASNVVLQLRANARVGVGDELALEMHVRNDSGESVTLVRPIYGSWELARSPRYELEWTDQSGAEIPDPLGFAPALRCGTLDPVAVG